MSAKYFRALSEKIIRARVSTKRSLPPPSSPFLSIVFVSFLQKPAATHSPPQPSEPSLKLHLSLSSSSSPFYTPSTFSSLLFPCPSRCRRSERRNVRAVDRPLNPTTRKSHSSDERNGNVGGGNACCTGRIREQADARGERTAPGQEPGERKIFI